MLYYKYYLNESLILIYIIKLIILNIIYFIFLQILYINQF